MNIMFRNRQQIIAMLVVSVTFLLPIELSQQICILLFMTTDLISNQVMNDFQDENPDIEDRIAIFKLMENSKVKVVILLIPLALLIGASLVHGMKFGATLFLLVHGPRFIVEEIHKKLV